VFARSQSNHYPNTVVRHSTRGDRATITGGANIGNVGLAGNTPMQAVVLSEPYQGSGVKTLLCGSWAGIHSPSTPHLDPPLSRQIAKV